MINILMIFELFNKQMLLFVILIFLGTFVNAQELNFSKKNLTFDDPQFAITSNNGVPLLNTIKSATIELHPGEVVTFKAHEGILSDMITWSAGTPSTFSGIADIKESNELTYTAFSNINPSLTSGVDTINVSDGNSTIVITIIISPAFIGIKCDPSKSLSVLPKNSDVISIKPLTSIVFTAIGGTCSYSWLLIENSSNGASLFKLNNESASYTSGLNNSSVDIIELSDGISTERIEIHIEEGKMHGSGNGCFIRNKRSQRD